MEFAETILEPEKKISLESQWPSVAHFVRQDASSFWFPPGGFTQMMQKISYLYVSLPDVFCTQEPLPQCRHIWYNIHIYIYMCAEIIIKALFLLQLGGQAKDILLSNHIIYQTYFIDIQGTMRCTPTNVPLWEIPI